MQNDADQCKEWGKSLDSFLVGSVVAVVVVDSFVVVVDSFVAVVVVAAVAEAAEVDQAAAVAAVDLGVVLLQCPCYLRLCQTKTRKNVMEKRKRKRLTIRQNRSTTTNKTRQ